MGFQAVVVCLFFTVKFRNCKRRDSSSESGGSFSWRTSNSGEEESSPLLSVDSSHRQYTEEKIQYYEQRRKMENDVSYVACKVASIGR